MAVPDHMNQNTVDSDNDTNESLNTNPKRRADITSAVDIDDEIIQGMTASYTEISFNTQSSEPDDSILEDNNLAFLQELDRLNKSVESKKKCEDYLNERPNNLELTKDGECSPNRKSDTNQPASHKALGYLNQLNGTVIQEGDMVLFVAEDLENKIKLSSPVSKKDDMLPGSESVWDSSSSSWLYKQMLTNQIIPLADVTILNDLELEVSKIATSVDSLTENLAEILHSVSALTVDCLETYRDVVCKTCDAVDLNIKSTYQLMAKSEELSKSMKPIYKLSEHIKEIKHFLDLLENATN